VSLLNVCNDSLPIYQRLIQFSPLLSAAAASASASRRFEEEDEFDFDDSDIEVEQL
jgi:hypothetical protein